MQPQIVRLNKTSLTEKRINLLTERLPDIKA
jgi:hypothetical protein